MKKLWHSPTELPTEELEKYNAILVEYVFGNDTTHNCRHMKFISYTDDYENVIDKEDYSSLIETGEIKEEQGGFYYYNSVWSCNDIFDRTIIRWCYRKDLEDME